MYLILVGTTFKLCTHEELPVGVAFKIIAIPGDSPTLKDVGLAQAAFNAGRTAR